MAFDSHSNFVEIQKLKKELSAKSGNLVRYDISYVAEEDGQTEFAIGLSTFNYLTDSVLVQSGGTLLSPSSDYIVKDHGIVLNEGVSVGRKIDIYIYKNVENLDEEKTIDGLQLAEGSVPLNRLADTPIPVEYGGTGATTAEETLENLGALPLTGGTMSGSLKTYAQGHMSGLNVYRDDTGHAGMKFENTNGTLGYVGVNGSTKKPFFANENGTIYNIFGEHNVINSTVTLTSSGWSNGYQTVGCASATATNNVMVSPAPDSFIAYGKAKVRCTAQSAGTLTFACDTSSVPTVNLVVNVMTMGV